MGARDPPASGRSAKVATAGAAAGGTAESDGPAAGLPPHAASNPSKAPTAARGGKRKPFIADMLKNFAAYVSQGRARSRESGNVRLAPAAEAAAAPRPPASMPKHALSP